MSFRFGTSIIGKVRKKHFAALKMIKVVNRTNRGTHENVFIIDKFIGNSISACIEVEEGGVVLQ